MRCPFPGCLSLPGKTTGQFSQPVCVQFTGTTCSQTGTSITNINPIAQAYIKDIFSKLPDAPANNVLNFALRNVFNARQELYRVDHVFNERWSVFGRFINDSIDMLLYQQLSTIAGNEVVVVPE